MSSAEAAEQAGDLLNPENTPIDEAAVLFKAFARDVGKAQASLELLAGLDDEAIRALSSDQRTKLVISLSHAANLLDTGLDAITAPEPEAQAKEEPDGFSLQVFAGRTKREEYGDKIYWPGARFGVAVPGKSQKVLEFTEKGILINNTRVDLNPHRLFLLSTFLANPYRPITKKEFIDMGYYPRPRNEYNNLAQLSSDMNALRHAMTVSLDGHGYTEEGPIKSGQKMGFKTFIWAYPAELLNNDMTLEEAVKVLRQGGDEASRPTSEPKLTLIDGSLPTSAGSVEADAERNGTENKRSEIEPKNFEQAAVTEQVPEAGNQVLASLSAAESGRQPESHKEATLAPAEASEAELPGVSNKRQPASANSETPHKLKASLGFGAFKNEVWVNGKKVELTRLEADILKIIYVAGRQPVNYMQLFRWLKPIHDNLVPETLDTAISLLNHPYKFGIIKQPVEVISIDGPDGTERYFALDETIERRPLDEKTRRQLLYGLLPS